jgi:hypothetical protein
LFLGRPVCYRCALEEQVAGVNKERWQIPLGGYFFIWLCLIFSYAGM